MAAATRMTQTQLIKKLAEALPQCKIDWDGGVIEPTQSADPERRAAEWVISIGGKVCIRIGGDYRQWVAKLC